MPMPAWGFSLHGVTFRRTNPMRTCLDLWRYNRRISHEHAYNALRRIRHREDFDLTQFERLARRLRVWG